LARRAELGVASSLLPLLSEPLERDAIRWLCTRAIERELEWRVLPLIYDALSADNFDLVDAHVARLLLRRFEEPDDVDDESPWERSPRDLEKEKLLEARAGVARVVH
jgi:hypothetical protein